jgi:hypothetical protein
MNAMDKRRYEMLIRLRNFGTTCGQLFAEASLAQPTFAALASALDRIQAQQVAANTATVSASAARTSSARGALLDQLTKIAATARVISETDADLGAHFKLADASNSQLLTTAHGLLENAAPFADAFVAHGMVPTFPRGPQGLDRHLRSRAARSGNWGRSPTVGARHFPDGDGGRACSNPENGRDCRQSRRTRPGGARGMGTGPTGRCSAAGKEEEGRAGRGGEEGEIL